MLNQKCFIQHYRVLKIFIFFLFCFSFCTLIANANESLRIAGMGGAFVGIYATEGGIFGNPAGLIQMQDNILSTAFLSQNLNYENLTLAKDEQMNTNISFRFLPSLYYSRKIGKFGFSLGYIYDLDNRKINMRVESTKAEYIVDERKFLSETNTFLEYDLFREKAPVFSIGYSLKPKMAIGIRFGYKNQILKKGTISRPFRLVSIHPSEVNRNDATKLIPAIIDNLDINDTLTRFKNGEDSHDDVVADLSGKGLDFDIGIQTILSETGNITFGFMLEHLIQHRIIDSQSSAIRLGMGAIPQNWIVTGLDLKKSLNSNGLDANFGWEISHKWKKWFSGGITIRNGFSHEQSKNNLSVGMGLILGGSQWNYTLVRPFKNTSIGKSSHIISSTTRF